MMRVLLFVALLLSGGAWAQTEANYPSRPIRIIVGFAPGGGNDVLARIVAQKMSETFGQPVVVENKPGAGGAIAAEYVAKAAPDGYTLMVGASGAMTINPAVHAKLSYAPEKDFAPISTIASFPLFVVAHRAAPVTSMQELVAYAKANPAKSNYGGASTAFQLAAELIKQKTGAPMEFVGYKSSGEAVQAVVTGEVLLTIADALPVAGQIRGNQVRALAITSKARSPEFPDIPTLAEAGVGDIEITLWSGVFAPARTPPAIVRKLEAEIIRVVRLPEVVERFRTLLVEPVGNSSADFARTISADIARWTGIAKAAGIEIR